MRTCSNFVLTGTSPAGPGTVVGPVSSAEMVGYRSMRVEATLAGATGGVLDVYLQVSYDGGVSWTDYAHFAQLAAGASSVTYGFTTTRAQADGLATAGKNVTPLLTVNTARGGEWGSAMRILFVAGASTSAGAAQTVKVYLAN